MDSSLTSPSADTRRLDALKFARPRRRSPAAGRGSWCVAAALVLGGCKLPSFGVYPGATTQGRTEFHLWQLFFIAGLVVGGFVLLLILWAVFQYRRKSEDIPKQTQYHTLLEIIYTVVPILIVIGAVRLHRAGREQGGRHARQPGRHASPSTPSSGAGSSSTPGPGRVRPPLQPDCVKVIGQTTAGPDHGDPGRHRRADHTSTPSTCCTASTSRSSTSAATPARATPDHSTSTRCTPGTIRGQCTQLCGLYHSLMFFNVRAVTPSPVRRLAARPAGAGAGQPGVGSQAPERCEGRLERAPTLPATTQEVIVYSD